MSFALLYLLFLKASLSSFNGLAAMPIIRQDLVVTHHAITDRQLNTSLAIGRTTPGPIGLYMVAAGYYAAGARGAMAATLALMTPALLVIPLLHFAGRLSNHPRVQQVLRAVVLGSAGVSLSATLPLGVDALHSPLLWIIAAASLAALVFSKVDSIWVILAASAASLLAAAVH